MYTLRKIIEGQEEMNFNLGNNYSLIDKHQSKQRFDITKKMFFENEPEKSLLEDCYAFVVSEKGKIEALWGSQKNYIMTENGKTFSNLSIK